MTQPKNSHPHKLTELQVRMIIALRPHFTVRDIGAAFGVSFQEIAKIDAGEHWSWATNRVRPAKEKQMNTSSKTYDPGKQAGEIDPATGYVVITIDGRDYLAHDLTWLYHYGAKPKTPLIHLNGVLHDNRIENLALTRPKR